MLQPIIPRVEVSRKEKNETFPNDFSNSFLFSFRENLSLKISEISEQAQFVCMIEIE